MDFSFIHRYFAKGKEYRDIISHIDNKLASDSSSSGSSFDLYLENLYGSSKSLVASRLFTDLSRRRGLSNSLLAVTATTSEAERMYTDAKSFLPNSKVFYFPAWEILPYESISPFYDIVHNRIEVLHNILLGEPILLITPVVNLMKVIIPKDIFKGEYLVFAVGDVFDYSYVISKLTELGYSREAKVEEPGTFSVKGGIIDIFPSSEEFPIRLEFFGDEVYSIRVFDVGSQVSVRELKSVEILPQRELIFTDESVSNAVSLISERFSDDRFKNRDKILSNIRDRVYFQGIEHLLPLFYASSDSTLLDYFDLDRLVVLFSGEGEVRKRSEFVLRECEELFSQSHKANMIKANPDEVYVDYDSIFSKIRHRIYLSKFSFVDRDVDREAVYSFSFSSMESFVSSVSLFRERALELLGNGYKIFIVSSYIGQARRLSEVFSDLSPVLVDKPLSSKGEIQGFSDNLSSGLFIFVSDIDEGFIIGDDVKLLLVLDREIFSRKRSFYRKLRKVSSSPIESFYDLKRDDLVVHINYGIGRYIGIERIVALGKSKDCILLLYADDEKLFVPIEQLNLVQKYIGSRGENASLDKLGSNKWSKTKARVQKDLEELARELISLYAKRREARGYAFMPDNKWQHDFELGFEYDETPDQLKAIEDIKSDMEQPEPMDRLICGDVGFGKTEVAIRAAFKAVMSGKQVVFLVPTTILCEQHYRTFKVRFELYPIEIEMLSRIESRQSQKSIINRLSSGGIDIIIGTHRLLSKDVVFKRLGLVIIDEEQRFGVRHKDLLKRLRVSVDVISMSATPIPRTLHMSLVKVRNMSVINTPPENRRPIETYISEFNEDIIKDAIYRELDRDGQVFFIFNRVKTIKGFARYLIGLVSGIRPCVIHGQMDEEEVDEIIMDFIDGKYNIMISTTILESGIDMPNVNTILIDRADTLGLSQLYQLRGRVGRGARKAYCYLFYPADRALSEIAQKRLAVINEYSDLGSGFKIAMKDMEFRGAGNILGIEQSGSIVSVGFELYCKLLDQAIKELRDDEKVYDYDIYVDLEYDAFIPDSYIEDEKQKIELYKKIAAIVEEEEIIRIKGEIQDRFGKPPSIVLNLLEIAKVKIGGKKLRIVSIVEKADEVSICFNEHSIIKVEKIPIIASSYSGLIRINPNTPDYLYINVADMHFDEKIELVKEILNKLKA